MAAELVYSATSEKLTEMDWMKNIEISELVAHDKGQARNVIKAIKKRLGNKNSNTQLFAVMLLEMLMNNFGECIHKQVIDTGLLSILVKIVKKKSDLPVREKIFHLLDATQTSLGGPSGKFPQYYTSYHDLVSAGVQFTQGSHVLPSDHPTLEAHKNNLPGGKPLSPRHEEVAKQADPQIMPESSIIQKAGATLAVLKEVLDAIDIQHPEGAKDEFTLDLVEQCSFQKQRVMHLVITSRDEKVLSKAIQLNEQLQKVLARHDALLSIRVTSTAAHFDNEEEEEEEAEQLFRRIRKGKACARPEDENHEQPSGLIGSIQAQRLQRPLLRPLCLEPQESKAPSPTGVCLEPQESKAPSPTVVIPPPPAKHIERERFFQEKRVDGSALAVQMRGLSLHSRNASSSHSESIESSE